MDNTQISSTEVANLETGNLTGATTSTEVTPASTTPVVATPVTPEMYDVKVNNQTIKVPLDELRNGYSRQQDYTKKTMELSQERQRYQQELSQYQDQIQKVQTFLSDPRVQNALRQLQAGVEDPSKPLTAEQAMQLQSQAAAHQQAQLEARMNQMQQELEVRSLANQYSSEIESTTRQLLDKHPVLQDIDGIDELLRRDVANRQPATLQEAKQFFAEAAQARADRLMQRFQTQQKEVAVQQGKLTKNGIEVGGQAPAIVPPEKKFKFGSNDLFQAAVSDMMNAAINK
jgi:hypothetical protein